jgi:Domain of unknown function (DUF4157)
MKPSIYRRMRRIPASHEATNANKESKQQQSFFGEATHETFFQPSPVIQRKCEKCEDEDKVQRQPEKKVEEKKLMSAEDKNEEEKIQKKEGTTSEVNTSTTAANYISSINSKGQSMNAGVQSFYESKMGVDFNDVKIHTGKEAAESAKDINAQAYAYGNHIVFNEGKYQPELSEGKHLLAHELAHVSQNNKKTKLDSTRLLLRTAARKKRWFGSKYVGWTIGTSMSGETVKILRELGSTDGYPEKLQAVSVYRLANAEPAGVVKDYYGYWHSFETTANFYGGLSSAHDFSPPNQEIYGLPSSKSIEDERKKDPRSRLYASLALGIDESDTLFNLSSASRKSGKVNFNAEFVTTINAPLGETGPETWGDNFEAGQSYALELATNLLDDPKKASEVLFHEASHLSDYKFSQYWVLQYQKETGGVFVSSAPENFHKWIWAQAPKRLSPGEAELVVNKSGNATAVSEARAYTHTILAAIQTGAIDSAKRQISTYVNGKVPMPATGSYAVLELTDEIKLAYKSMEKAKKAQLKDLIASAKSKNSSVWISQIVL